ncbi:hypothetical protein L210DRAFT_2441572 [Boletus edulis BED1]|uniref:Uncharacterized protein n=1 Tax=Boletus edulis BED1 TaxID=1328754 RepID=A0AAD4BQW2_BOLED|nr:hypothetical protein L210DRAFT_2441572 [Boletus edulis BED1]
MKRQRWEGRLTPMLNCFIEDVYQKRWYRIWAVATATCFLGRAARYVWSKEVLGPDTHCLRRTPAWCMSLQPNALRSSSSSGGMSSSQDGVRSVWASVASGTRPGATIASGGGRFWRGACKAGQTRKVTFRCTHTLQSPVYTCPISPPNPSFRGQQTHGPSQATSGVRVGAHHQTGTRINATTGTGTGTEMHESVNANAGTARVMHPVGNVRLIPHVLRILILPVPVIHITFGAMMMSVPATTVGTTGIATETETGGTGTGTEIGTGTGDTTDETPGHPGTTTVQTAPPQVEEAMVPETVNGAVVTTTEEKETGNEGGVGTMTNHDPEIANMTDDLLPRSTVPHHHPRAVVSPLSHMLVHALKSVRLSSRTSFSSSPTSAVVSISGKALDFS